MLIGAYHLRFAICLVTNSEQIELSPPLRSIYLQDLTLMSQLLVQFMSHAPSITAFAPTLLPVRFSVCQTRDLQYLECSQVETNRLAWTCPHRFAVVQP